VYVGEPVVEAAAWVARTITTPLPPNPEPILGSNITGPFILLHFQ